MLQHDASGAHPDAARASQHEAYEDFGSGARQGRRVRADRSGGRGVGDGQHGDARLLRQRVGRGGGSGQGRPQDRAGLVGIDEALENVDPLLLAGGVVLDQQLDLDPLQGVSAVQFLSGGLEAILLRLPVGGRRAGQAERRSQLQRTAFRLHATLAGSASALARREREHDRNEDKAKAPASEAHRGPPGQAGSGIRTPATGNRASKPCFGLDSLGSESMRR